MATFIYYLGAFTFCTSAAAACMAVITYLDKGARK